MSPVARQRAAALLACAAGAALSLLAATRTWVTVSASRTPPLDALTVAVSGRSIEPVVPALAIVGLAGVIGLLATRGVGRRILGLVLLAAGLAVAARAGAHLVAPDRAAALDLIDADGPTIGVPSDSALSSQVSALWPVLAGLGGLVQAAAGLVAFTRGHRWSGMSRRYDAPGRDRDPEETNRALWDAMDDGRDPTGEAKS